MMSTSQPIRAGKPTTKVVGGCQKFYYIECPRMPQNRLTHRIVPVFHVGALWGIMDKRQGIVGVLDREWERA